MGTSKLSNAGSRKRTRLWRRVLFSVLVAVTCFLLLEGAASTIFVVHKLMWTKPLAERLHTQYDSELGWINKADFQLEEMYGPGVHLRINSQRFRNDRLFNKEVPTDRVRIICSGDSFTLGYGVDDEHTWPAQLAALDERIQTVNMGQGGYGIGQAYLWYWRVKDQLEHHVHLFSFIDDDFVRMQLAEIGGYGKPVLQIEEGQLVVTNVPVPQTAYELSGLITNTKAIGELSTVKLVRKMIFSNQPQPSIDQLTASAREVAVAIFDRLQEHHRRQGSSLVLVHIPLEADHLMTRSPWREFLREQAGRHGWIYLDLVDDFRQLSHKDVSKLYLHEGEVDYPGAAGHFNKQGNRFVAELLHRRLLEISQVAAKLNAVALPRAE